MFIWIFEIHNEHKSLYNKSGQISKRQPSIIKVCEFKQRTLFRRTLINSEIVRLRLNLFPQSYGLEL